MEVLGEFEAEGNCGVCGARLRVKGSDIRCYTETRLSFGEYDNEGTPYTNTVYYVTCGSCGERSMMPTIIPGFMVPNGVIHEAMSQRYDGHYDNPLYLMVNLLHPRAI